MQHKAWENDMITIRLDHAAIAADNTTALAAWYIKHLGLVIHVEAGPIAPQTQKVYMIGPPVPPGEVTRPLLRGMMLEIMPRNDTPRHQRNSHEPGHSHLAFAVADFDGTLSALRAANVKFLSDVIAPIGGGRIISFEDGEKNMIQIVERL
jgi:catechol 2,3-dioxygenase-like lactoylglutathione lyase family enzyme